MIGSTSAGNEGMAVYLKGKKPCLSVVARAGKESKTVWQYAKTTPWMGEVESSLEQRPTPIGI